MPIEYPPSPSAALPQLADASGYAACRWDLKAMGKERAYWLALFRRHFPSLLGEALRVAEADREDMAQAHGRAQAAGEAFSAYLDRAGANPAAFARLDILEICYERERVLRRFGFADPYRLAKARETEVALAVLPALLRELDAMPEAERRVEIMRGVFAGNIFDLGATATQQLFQERSVDFHATRGRLKPRPWLLDDLDAWLARYEERAWRAALLFVDNAGPDVTLGMIPLARELTRRGTRVLLAANTHPSLNDVTAAELEALLDRIDDAVLRDARAAGRLRVLADGNGAPLIDLTKLDPAFVAAVEREPVDLVVLEGMGRAVESNLHVPFACDVLKMAMIKDEGVAEALGGSLYDLVLRFERADRAGAAR